MIKFNARRRIEFSRQTAILMFCVLILCSPDTSVASGSSILDLSFSQERMNLNQQSGVDLSFQLKTRGTITIKILDLDGHMVKNIAESEDLEAGAHKYVWDGRDGKGRKCYNGWYFPYITFNSSESGYEVIDPTQAAWGERIEVDEPSYSSANGKVTFTLPKPAMCLVRLGEVGDDFAGPVYGALFDWSAFEAGHHQMGWDGWDDGRTLKIGDQGNFVMLLDAYSLPTPGIVVTNGRTPLYQPSREYLRFPVHPPHGKDVVIHAHHPRCFSHELPLDVTVVNDQGETQKNHNKLSNAIAFEAGITGDHDKDQLISESLEGYIFVDGKMVYERPFDGLPVRLTLDTRQYENGEHIVVVVVRTLQDRLGSRTLRVKFNN